METVMKLTVLQAHFTLDLTSEKVKCPVADADLTLSPAGPRQPGASHDLVSQRHVDVDSGPRRLRQVLAIQHEQRQDVPGSQGGH